MDARAGRAASRWRKLLATDVTFTGDSGGKNPGPLRPVYGAGQRCASPAWWRPPPIPDLDYRIAEVNGGPAVLICSDETPIAVLILGLEELIATITAQNGRRIEPLTAATVLLPTAGRYRTRR